VICYHLLTCRKPRNVDKKCVTRSTSSIPVQNLFSIMRLILNGKRSTQAPHRATGCLSFTITLKCTLISSDIWCCGILNSQKLTAMWCNMWACLLQPFGLLTLVLQWTEPTLKHCERLSYQPGSAVNVVALGSIIATLMPNDWFRKSVHLQPWTTVDWLFDKKKIHVHINYLMTIRSWLMEILHLPALESTNNQSSI
jgi:hypothetical protein